MYCQGYVILRNANIRIIAHDMAAIKTYSAYKQSSGVWSAWVELATSIDLSSKVSTSAYGVGDKLAKLTAVATDNIVDTCYLTFTRKDGTVYKLSIGNSSIMFQKYENSAWTTLWTK